jgi:hypothetical protein
MRFRLLATPCSHRWTVTAWKHSPTGEALDTYSSDKKVQKELQELLTIHTVSHTPVKIQLQEKTNFNSEER